MNRQFDEEAIFHVARWIDNPEARSVYLDQMCTGDQPLRERVEALLKVHDQEQEFLNSESPNPPPTADAAPPTERPDATIGRYHLMEQIGEGGMGVVYVAEQEKPIRRKVALKVIKPGMDSKTVIARFESERQALAMMDHVNIAKVLDAGTTDAGRPYFVMELVHGIPITDYCDRNKLTVRDRLELFIQVCQAIQHAHQKGIIHRDIKPTNVLVTLHDGKPVPKVIDFGVAKALHQRLTERTVYTSFAQVVGTPLYMSPEQAELSGLDIDTRSDVYSLGALLYELLTGTTLFEKQQFAKAAYDEIRRIIRETDPPKPSTKIGSLGETAMSVSMQRGTDQRTLSRVLTGDLDIIAMKALEKDRTRRYDTASGLAADVQRFLNDEPIVARPPSLVYRSGKFARRNQVAVVTSVLVLTSLLVAVIATSWSAHRAHDTLRRLADAFYRQAVAAALAGDLEKARSALDYAKDADAPPRQIALLNGLIALNSGEYDDAIAYGKKALTEDPRGHESANIGAHALLFTAYVWAGFDDLSSAEMQSLQQLRPESDTDHLLMAYAMLANNPRRSLELLESEPAVGHSPIGLSIRAMANLLLGYETDNAQLVDTAIQDFEYVQFLFRDNTFIVHWRLLAVIDAMELAQRQGRQQDIHELAEQGRSFAKRLETAAECPGIEYALWMFYQAIGEDEQAMLAIRRLGAYRGTYLWYLAADCLRRNDAAAAMREFDQALVTQHEENKYVDLAKMHLVRNLPGDVQQIQRSVTRLLSDTSPLIQREALLALCLVSTPSQIRTQAQELAVEIRHNMPALFDPYGDATNIVFLAGWLDEPQLLERAHKSKASLANAHFTIAMLRLAEGNREAAHEQLKLSVATQAVGHFDYEWARAYLAHMDADPTWPGWIREDAGK